MTSFLALRASVCAYLWCLIPPVCYIGFEQRHPSHSQSDFLLDTFPLADGRQFETCLTRIFFSHLSGLNFAKVHLRIRTRVLTFLALGVWFVFRHGCLRTYQCFCRLLLALCAAAAPEAVLGEWVAMLLRQWSEPLRKLHR